MILSLSIFFIFSCVKEDSYVLDGTAWYASDMAYLASGGEIRYEFDNSDVYCYSASCPIWSCSYVLTGNRLVISRTPELVYTLYPHEMIAQNAIWPYSQFKKERK